MMQSRRQILALAAAAAFTGGAGAQSFPTAPIKLIVPYGAGGIGDVVARMVAEKASADLGQPVVVENRSGANGVIGAQAAARSKPDGYTLMLMATGHVILPSLQQMPYDWKRDLVPVSGVTATPLVIAVRGKSNIRTVADLVATAKATPNGLNYASGGGGSISHLAAARFVKELKVNGTHVAFRGFSPAVQALLGDQVHFICATVGDVIELTKSGDFRLLAVTADRRHPLLPDVPTMKEQGLADFEAASWNAFLAPANTPPEVVERLHRAFVKAVSDPAVQERLAKLGVGTQTKSRPELARFLEDESVRWKRVIEENAIKVES